MPPAPPTGPGGTGNGSSGRPNWARRSIAIGALAAVMVGSGVTGGVVVNALDGGGGKTTTAAAVTVSDTSSSATEQLAKVAAAVQPSVVSIVVTASGQTDEGSGVILTSDGTIMTNNHVVEAAANGGSITVTFSNGKKASASIVGRDPSSDIAVIKASGVSGLTPATLGDSSSLHVGDTVLAIGSPLGLANTVTSGIVSALHRSVDLGNDQQTPSNPSNPFGQQQQQQSQQSSSVTLSDAIQTDAAINPGNSGGALVDDNGHVVGINSAIATTSSSSGNIGVGFAIPIEKAKSVADQLISGKTPQHAALGVSITDATNGGAQITAVTANSAAARAGLKAGDVITAIDGTQVTDGNALAAAITAKQPGDSVTVHYTRDGADHTVKVTLGSSGS